MIDVETFRKEARDFLSARALPDENGASVLEVFTPRSEDEEATWVAANRAWQRELYEAGFAGITFPADIGGRGLLLGHGLVWAEEESGYAVPRGLFGVTLEMIAPTLLAVGTPQQREAVRPILRGEEVWCQLFPSPTPARTWRRCRPEPWSTGVAGCSVAKGLDVGGAPRAVGLRPGPDRPDRPKARGADGIRGGSRPARCVDPAAAADDRRVVVQRGVLLRRRCGARRGAR